MGTSEFLGPVLLPLFREPDEIVGLDRRAVYDLSRIRRTRVK